MSEINDAANNAKQAAGRVLDSDVFGESAGFSVSSGSS